MNPMLGIGSGLDLNTMLDSLVRVASEPKVKQLGQKEVEAKDAVSGLGALKSLLSSFQSAADALKDTSEYSKRSATVTQPSSGEVLTATADESAVSGTYNIVVNDIAKGSRVSTAQIPGGHDDALTFSGAPDANGVKDTLEFYIDGNASFTPFSIDLKDGMSLNDMASAISSHEDNFGVTATVIDGRLVYDSSVLGADNNLESKTSLLANVQFSVGKDLTGFTDSPASVVDAGDVTLRVAQDASIEINGIPITKDSNDLGGVITGVSLTLTDSAPGEVSTVTVAQDTSSIKSKIEAYASAYNKLREGMNELKGNYDKDAEQFVYGKLSGDPIIRNIESVLGGILTQQVVGAASGADTLYAIGLEIESDGTLSVDSARLDDAVSENFDDLEKLFTGDNGIATLTSERMDAYLGFDGVIKGKEDSYNDILDDLEVQYEAHARYIEGYQATLMKQFTALDSTVSRLQGTMSQIAPQLAALSNISYS
ncbi:flagellar filament capping protein FliD [Oceanospirillum beijerinckii]|uniref:flagellar filament capping protein FliD n=1 Tax=Oceanospirillum beijerinckii TaxID=64976 RepID=UPI0004230E84|nr:flagellar filament capping protein FliD [Oceanospirillum beijerinckii]